MIPMSHETTHMFDNEDVFHVYIPIIEKKYKFVWEDNFDEKILIMDEYDEIYHPEGFVQDMLIEMSNRFDTEETK
jgi:hypothetical protein